MGRGTYIAVGEADDEPVLGSTVLGLVLGDQPLAGIVVGLSFSSSLVLRLEAREVGVVLDVLGEGLCESVSQQFRDVN